MKDGKPNPDLTATPEEPSPPIPEEYRKYLLSKPVKAVVTEVLQLQRVFTNNATETEVMARTKVALRVKIPAGEVLLEGHELLREGDGELAAWTVVKVEGESCTVSGASEWRVYKEGDVKSTTPEIPAAGSKLSTRWKP
jgi:hypothetical protein